LPAPCQSIRCFAAGPTVPERGGAWARRARVEIKDFRRRQLVRILDLKNDLVLSNGGLGAPNRDHYDARAPVNKTLDARLQVYGRLFPIGNLE
jgi:hypothetical protein